MVLRDEPENEMEEYLLYLTEWVSSAILESHPKPHNLTALDPENFSADDRVFVQFETNKRKLSWTQAAFRRIVYTTRNINDIKKREDAVELVVHECCHLAYQNHSPEFWLLYLTYKTAFNEVLAKRDSSV